MDLTHSFDPLAAAFVLGGTLAATLLRCGTADCRVALRVLGKLGARPFDIARTKAELAAQIEEIGRDGFLRAEPHHSGDGEFDELADRLISQRSVKALYDQHRRHRERRMALTARARDVLLQAADLSPVLGMAGTLLSLGSMTVKTAGSVGGTGSYVSSIGMAVGTTFFGLVCAHFLFAPLAAAISRRAQAEERARQALLDWLAAGVEKAVRPHGAVAAAASSRRAA
jgi:chemotaxis protein MotA